MKAINRPNKETAEAFVFAWIDTREVRPAESTAVAVLNDTEHLVASGVMDALRSYEVNPVRWSAREAALNDLAA